jgi:hypothetical protein
MVAEPEWSTVLMQKKKNQHEPELLHVPSILATYLPKICHNACEKVMVKKWFHY